MSGVSGDEDAVRELLRSWRLSAISVEKIVAAGITDTIILGLVEPEDIPKFGLPNIGQEITLRGHLLKWKAACDQSQVLTTHSPLRVPSPPGSIGSLADGSLQDEPSSIANIRQQQLAENRVYNIIMASKGDSLKNKALTGENGVADNKGETSVLGPATLSDIESRELMRLWMCHLFDLSIARGDPCDQFTLTDADFHQWAEEIVFCFPGEAVDTWYCSSRGSLGAMTERIGATCTPTRAGKLWWKYNNRCKFRTIYYPDQPSAKQRSSTTLSADRPAVDEESSDATQTSKKVSRRLRDRHRRKSLNEALRIQEQLIQQDTKEALERVLRDRPILAAPDLGVATQPCAYVRAWDDCTQARRKWLAAAAVATKSFVEEYVQLFPALRIQSFAETLFQRDFENLYGEVAVNASHTLKANLIKYQGAIIAEANRVANEYAPSHMTVLDLVHIKNILDRATSPDIQDDYETLCGYLLLLLPIVIRRGTKEVGENLSSRREAYDAFAVALADDEELENYQQKKKNELMESLRRAAKSRRNSKTADASSPGEIESTVLKSLKPFVVSWGHFFQSLDSFSILYPNGQGGWFRHDYPSSSLPEVVVHYLKGIHGFNIDPPKPARSVWVFVERALIGLRNEESVPFRNYLTTISRLNQRIAAIDNAKKSVDPNKKEGEPSSADNPDLQCLEEQGGKRKKGLTLQLESCRGNKRRKSLPNPSPNVYDFHQGNSHSSIKRAPDTFECFVKHDPDGVRQHPIKNEPCDC